MYVDHYVPIANGDNGVMVANAFAGRNFDAGLRRPYIADKGKYAGQPCVTVTHNNDHMVERGQRVRYRKQVPLRELILNGVVPPVFNATALRKEEWVELDKVVLRAARYRLKLWGRLSQSVPYGGFNGMNKMILEHETMSDPGVAVQDMDGLSESQGDAPLFQLEGLPLVITHSDFSASARKLAISRNTGTPLDTNMGEAAGRRVGETIEKVAIGMKTGITYGGNSTQVGGYGRNSTVYGLVNFTPRLTKTNVTAPTAGGWSPTTTINEILAAINQLRANKFFGPFTMYYTGDWDTYLDGDYYYAITSGAVAPSRTLRSRILGEQGIKDITALERLDMWFPTAPSTTIGPGVDYDPSLKAFSFVLIQETSDVIQAVNGMDVTTVQWETVGGMQVNFKVMAIQVPRFRADYYGNCGLCHCTTS